MTGRTILCAALVCTSSAYTAFAQTASQRDEQEQQTSEERACDLHTFIPNVLADQKRVFASFPSGLAHGKHWAPVLLVAAATTGAIIADQYDAGYFRRTKSWSDFNSVFSSANTAAAIVLTPVAFYSAGYFSRDNYAKQTAFLTAESAVDGEIVDFAMKLVSDRQRPSAIPQRSNFADSFEEGKSHFNGSFPSAHTVAAFSVATVISRRYGQRHKWVPLVAYGLSSAIGFSRISASAHFPSDVFFGAMVGYSIGRFAVLHQ